MTMPNNIGLLKNEERRLLQGPGENENIGGLGTIRYIIHCNGNASLVLKRSKDVLLKVNRAFQERVPEEEEWYSLLPDYFVYSCRPDVPLEQSQKEVELDRKLLNCLSLEDRGIWCDLERWHLSSWIYWFQEENRYWYWWDSYVHENSHIFVAIEVHEWPYPSGNLSWLFRGCGAYSVKESEKKSTHVQRF